MMAAAKSVHHQAMRSVGLSWLNERTGGAVEYKVIFGFLARRGDNKPRRHQLPPLVRDERGVCGRRRGGSGIVSSETTDDMDFVF